MNPQIKRLIYIFTTAILFVGTFVLLKSKYSTWLRVKNSSIDYAMELKEIDYLLIGSSSFRKGLDPEKLAKHLGGISIVAYNGNTPLQMKEELLFLMSNGVKIKRLVLELNPLLFSSIGISDLRLLLDLDYKSKINIFNTLEEKGWKDVYEFFVLSNNDYIITYPIVSPILSRRYERGGSNMSDDSITKEHGLTSIRHPIEKEESPIRQEHIDAIGDIIKIARDNNIDLFFIEMPKFKILPWQIIIRRLKIVSASC